MKTYAGDRTIDGIVVTVDGNPLDDIGNTQKIAGVVVNGRYLSRAELDKMLAGVEEAATRKF